MKKFITLLLATLLFSAAHAQLLILWDLENVSGPFPTGELGFNTASTIALPSELTVSSTAGSNRILIDATLSGAAGTRSVVTSDINGNATSQALQLSPFAIGASPVSSADFLSFDVDVDPGYQLNITSIDYDLRVTTATGTTGGLSLDTSLFVDSGAGFSIVGSTTTVTAGNGPATSTLAGSITGFSPITGNAEIRIAFGDNSGASFSSKANYVDNIALYGTVTVVPEASSYAAIAGLLALAHVFTRRRR